MRIVSSRQTSSRRSGAATVEFAVLLPLLWVLFGMGGRLRPRLLRPPHHCQRGPGRRRLRFRYAHHGSRYGGNSGAGFARYGLICPMSPSRRPLARLNSVSYLTVNVTYPFSTVTPVPFIPSTLTINQTCVMRIEPTTPAP